MTPLFFVAFRQTEASARLKKSDHSIRGITPRHFKKDICLYKAPWQPRTCPTLDKMAATRDLSLFDMLATIAEFDFQL